MLYINLPKQTLMLIFVRGYLREYDEFDSLVINQINQLPVRAEIIARETRKDSNLGKIVQNLEAGKCLKKSRIYVSRRQLQANFWMPSI